MRDLLNNLPTKKVRFLGQYVEIKPLSIETAIFIEEERLEIDKMEDGIEKQSKQMEFSIGIIQKSVVEAQDLTMAEMKQFPVNDILDLFNKVLDFSEDGKIDVKKK